ncbi:uncharacterized protein LOC129599601 [Paramacrobiotus metropolitanus]|uniref:uncharacterized protein LOC129599601 n=1 Tax=Paramacrobiotus metropolitanus TaxID=2943436 RepID=UPI0024460813|nr:uncharacterized protein LOC129599601 [Paramacrobiotus metropolitanus]
MHFYEVWSLWWKPSKRSLDIWNAVNVEVDGLLQLGHVVGLDTTGNLPRLTIDFGCTTQHSVLVEYGKVFDFSDSSPVIKTRKREFCCVPAGDEYEDVQVLLRHQPDHPWKWYPAKLLVLEFEYLQEYALVEVLLEGQRVRELIPVQQIRAPSSREDLQRRMVRPIDFVIRSCNVPQGYWTTTELVRDLFREKLEEWRRKRAHGGEGLRILSVLSQTITYLQRGGESPVSDVDAVSLLKEAERFAGFQKPKTVEVEEEAKRKKPLCTIELSTLALPPVLLAEVSKTLDTVERQRCRRVSHLWNEILTSDELCKEVFLSMKDGRYGKLPCDYATFACVFKYVTPAMRTICIRDADDNCECGFEHENTTVTGELIKYTKKVSNASNIRIDRLVMHTRSISISQHNYSVWDYFPATTKCIPD